MYSNTLHYLQIFICKILGSVNVVSTSFMDRNGLEYTPDPYADYAILLSDGFTPISHANTLVLATNDPSDKQTDLTSPMKRAQYDFEEVSRRVEQLVL